MSRLRVLVVDDDAVSRMNVEAMIRTLGHDCRSAPDGRAGWDALQHERIDVLITDRQMPYLDGLELCRLVREEFSTRHVYVIVVTGLASREQAREGMLAGADDYLTKPTQMIDVELRLIAAERVISLHRDLESASRELRAVARRDPLTGLGNRRSLTEDLAVMCDRQRRYGQLFSIALLDVDHFKAYNDRYGHQLGDEVLQAVGTVLQQSSRRGDVWYRYGGEEFLGVYPEQDAAGVLVGIERVRAGLASLAIPHADSLAEGLLTVSVGVAEGDGTRGEHELVRAADEALYNAKRRGRNRVEVAPLVSAPVLVVPSARAAQAAPGRDVPVVALKSPATLPPVVEESSDGAPRAVDVAVLDALLRQFEGQETDVRSTLLNSYLDQSSGHVAELVVAAADADGETVARLAHKLRSSSALLGATVLAELLASVEESADGGADALSSSAERIRDEYERVSAELMALRVA